jgi:hypothetical protein
MQGRVSGKSSKFCQNLSHDKKQRCLRTVGYTNAGSERDEGSADAHGIRAARQGEVRPKRVRAIHRYARTYYPSSAFRLILMTLTSSAETAAAALPQALRM